MTFDNEVRLRSDAELKAQNDGLVILKKILDDVRVIHYLSSGTLLGAIRDKDFIPWDWDVQMYLLMEDAYPLRHKISKALVNGGFTIHKFHDSEDSLKWEVRREGAIFELTAWYLLGKWRYRKKKRMRVPSYLFEGECNISFKGVKYPTLNPPEEYLEFCYGDWKTPIRPKLKSDKGVYSTSRHMRDYTAINKPILLFKYVLRKLVAFSKSIKRNLWN